MIGGVVPVLYSYYAKSGALDLDAHVRQIDWVMPRGAAGVTLLGLASEGASLTQDERKSIIARTARHLSPDAALLVTTRTDDDLHEIARIALATRRDVGLLVQRRSFLKAEYNSIELDQHLRTLGKTFDLLTGRNGQNFVDYLRIGATGVIPGPEMTAPLSSILSDWNAGKHADAVARYGAVAVYIDFAMQDLDTVIDVGRTITARALGLDAGIRRRPSGREGPSFDAAIEFWFSRWREFATT